MQDYVSNVDDYTDAVRDKFFDNIYRAGKMYQGLLKWYLDTPPERTGHEYHNIEGKSSHTAAAPDPEKGGAEEPPAPLSRELINSIKLEQGATTDTTSEVYIKSDLDYVLALEFGNMEKNLKAKPAWNVVLVTMKDELGDVALDGFYRR